MKALCNRRYVSWPAVDESAMDKESLGLGLKV